jgi:uncharacterized SAM-binding protein YcdF (DUF218 family)
LWARAILGGARTGKWLLGLSVLTALAGFPFFASQIQRYEEATTEAADGIVVLTGGAERIADAVALLQRGAGRRLLISGVNERVSRDELVRHAPALRSLLGCCVDFGYDAKNTVGNALETRRWRERNGFGSIMVVTSSYHMPRALAEFGAAMPGTRITAFPVVNDRLDMAHWWENPQTIRLLAVEYVKYLVAHARIRIESEPGALWGTMAGGTEKLAQTR